MCWSASALWSSLFKYRHFPQVAVLTTMMSLNLDWVLKSFINRSFNGHVAEVFWFQAVFKIGHRGHRLHLFTTSEYVNLAILVFGLGVDGHVGFGQDQNTCDGPVGENVEGFV